MLLSLLVSGNTVFGQGQMVITESGGPFYFDSPQIIPFPDAGDSLPSAFALIYGNFDNATNNIYCADNGGMWKLDNNSTSAVGNITFPSSRVSAHGQFDSFVWDELPKRKVLTGRVNGDEFVDVVTLDSIRRTNQVSTVVVTQDVSRIEILWGKSSPNLPGGNNIITRYDLGFLATDLAVHWSDGNSGATLCIVGQTGISLLRAPDSGTEPLRSLPVPELTVNPGVVCGINLGTEEAFAIAGNPVIPPQTAIDLGLGELVKGLDVFVPGPPTEIVTRATFVSAAGDAKGILAADLDRDGNGDEVALIVDNSPHLLIRDASLHIFDMVTANAETTITQSHRILTGGEPTALTSGDLGSTPDQRDSFPELIIAGRRDEKSPCWVKIYRNPRSLNQAWNEQEVSLVIGQPQVFADYFATLDPPMLLFDPNETVLTDLSVGLLNNDDIPDILAITPGRQTEDNAGEFVLLRGQPPAIATFITVATHGHRGLNSILGASRFGPTEEPVLDEFNAALGEIVMEINRARRNQEPQLLPVRHIGISGHWGDLTEEGAFLHVVGRGFWLGSSYFVVAPTCITPFLPIPALTPLDYWASCVFLFLPSDKPPCLIGSPDLGTHVRFIMGAIGAGIEECGRQRSGRASRAAAAELARQIEDATELARSNMDCCRGQIYLDLSGHSRGTPVTFEALRRIRQTISSSEVSRYPLLYNTTVTVTDLDGIDPSPNDSFRPWARAGFIVGDPQVGYGVGNESISSLHAGAFYANATMIPIGGIRPLVTPVISGGDRAILGDIVGAPVGYNRSGDYSSGFPAAGNGPMVSALTFDHNVQTHYWDLTQLTVAPSNVLPGSFVMESTTTLGRFFPRNTSLPNSLGPRADIPAELGTDGLGWMIAPAPRFNRQISSDHPEASFLPPNCNCAAGTGAAPPSDDLDSGPAASPAMLTRERIREFVADYQFNVAYSVVRNAREFISSFPVMDKGQRQELELFLHSDVRAFVKECADQSFVPMNVWQRKALPHSRGRVTLQSLGREFSHQRVKDAVLRSTAPQTDLADTKAVKMLAASTRKQLESLESSQPDALRDRMRYYQRLLSGAINLEEAFVEFPDAPAAIAQDLHVATTQINKGLNIELDYEFLPGRHPSSLSFGVKTRDLLVDIIPRLGRRRVVYPLLGRTVADPTVVDQVVLTGERVRVYSVSVRTDGPVRNPVDGRWYDLRVIEGGVDWDFAQLQASRSEYKGREGRLAGPLDVRAYAFLQEAFDLDAYVWLSGRAAPGSGDRFQWADGSQQSVNWKPGTQFPVKGKEPVYAIGHPQGDGPFFSYLPQQSEYEQRSIGVLIDYGKL